MKRPLSHTLSWAAALLAVASAACANEDGRLARNDFDSLRTDPSMTASLPDSSAPFVGVYDPPTDERIAHDLLKANSMDSALGVQAQRLAKNSEVRAFGEHMARDHGQNNVDLQAVLKRQSIVPRAGADSASMARDAEMTRAQLDTTKAFDVAYIGRAMQMHRDLLQKLDSTMIPNVRNAELKSHLEKTRPHVADHLKKSEDLQAKLPRGASNP
jgi:putative membrane protein